MSATFPDPIHIHLHDSHDRVVWMRQWEGNDTPAARARVRCSLSDLSGTGVFNISTGYGETKGLTDWQMTPSSQAALILWAKTQGREIEPTERRAPRRRSKRAPKTHKKQTGFDF